MVTAISRNPIPPYMSFSTFTTFLDWIKEMPVSPSQIDRSLLETKFSGSVGAQVVSGMRFLSLLDGNRPTQALEDLARSENHERKSLLETCLRKAYGNDMVDGLKSYTPSMLGDKLRELGTTDATHQKAASFFINAGRYADIEMPATIRKRARNKPARVRAARTREEQSLNGGGEIHAEPLPAVGLRPIVAALIDDLKVLGNKWTVVERESWLNTFRVALEYAYPAKETNDQEMAGTE